MSDTLVFDKETSIKFFVLAGSFSDLSEIDFSFLNIRCLKIDSQELVKICEDATYKDWTNRTFDLFEEIKNEFWDGERLYVLLPIDFSKEFKVDDFYLIHEVLLVLYPSDLAIKNIIDFQLFDDKYLHWIASEEYTFHNTGIDNIYDNYLVLDDENISEVNGFIPLYVNRIQSIKYLSASKNAYLSSFHERNPVMSFISLCISLESIVNSTTEINYRINRNIAVLLGENQSRAETIFDNLKLIYELRSKIVHGSDYNFEKVLEYLPYLQKIVSRTIIELVLHNIQDINSLNRKLTFVGFGDNKSLSKDYKKMILNIISYVDSFFKVLKK